MATIDDVARRAEVSTGTVSRVLNNHPAVRAATRRTVLAAIDALNYRPNPVARNLRRARTGAIGVVLARLANPANLATLNGIAAMAHARDVSLFVCDSAGSARQQAAHLAELCARRVDGVILQPISAYRAQLAPLLRAGIPVVIASLREPDGPQPQLVIDEFETSLAACRLLLYLGHRRIALLQQGFGGKPLARGGTGRNRERAYLQGHAEIEVPVDPTLNLLVGTSDDARTATAALLARADPPTAMICGPHYVAPAALLAIREAGLAVPTDLSFITYGDSPWAEAFNPPLTVVRTDYQDMGRRLVELLFSAAAAPSTSTVHQRAELVIRESCAAPRRALAGREEAS